MEDSAFNEEKTEVTQVPAIVQERFGFLKKLKDQVDEAMDKAGQAQDSANNAKDKRVGVFKKKDAIESLQSAAGDLAAAQISSASAQKALFEYQQKVGEVMKYLLALGVSNIAMNRSLVKELELRLKEASKEELDDIARNEIIDLIKQLKAHEDFMNKHESLSQIVQKHDNSLREKELIDLAQNEEIQRQADKDDEHDRRLDEKDRKDDNQDEILKTLLTDKENLSMRIVELEKKCEKYEIRLREDSDEISKLKATNSKNNSMDLGMVCSVAAVLISVVALIVSLI